MGMERRSKKKFKNLFKQILKKKSLKGWMLIEIATIVNFAKLFEKKKISNLKFFFNRNSPQNIFYIYIYIKPRVKTGSSYMVMN